jgi:hypothetical protein
MDTPTFNDRRQQARLLTTAAIQKARTADRVARDRARKVRMNRPDWANLTAQAKEDAISEAESNIMETRRLAGNDAETKMAEATHQESQALAAINLEENEQKMKNLGAGDEEDEEDEDDDDDEDDDGTGHITEAFTRNMKPVIERWEAKIVAEGQRVAPGVSQRELDEFAATASNKAGVKAYLEGLGGKSGDDDDEDEDEDENEDEADDIEIVVSSGDDDEDDEDVEMEDFIVEG